MKHFFPTFRLIAGLAAACAASGAERPSKGDKIEFSAPRESSVLRPESGADNREDRLNLDRRDSSSVSSQIPAGMPLPAPDNVNRARLLMDLIERRNGALREDLSGGGVALDDSTLGDRPGKGSGIDDLFERPNSRGGRSRDDIRNRDKKTDRTQDRDRPAIGENDAEKVGGEPGEGRSGPGMDRRGDGGFLPGLDSDSLMGLGAVRPDRSENFLDPGQGLSRNVNREDRESAANARRLQRAEDWNRLLGRSSTADRLGLVGGKPGNNLGVAGPVGPGAGAPGAPGAAGTANPQWGGAVAPTVDASGGEKRFDLPGRSSEVELGLGRNYGRTSLDQNSSTPAPPRAMEMFQKKHNVRLPTRDF